MVLKHISGLTFTIGSNTKISLGTSFVAQLFRKCACTKPGICSSITLYKINEVPRHRHDFSLLDCTDTKKLLNYCTTASLLAPQRCVGLGLLHRLWRFRNSRVFRGGLLVPRLTLTWKTTDYTSSGPCPLICLA
jgi:hypothetical protein